MSGLELALTILFVAFSVGLVLGAVLGYSLANVRDKHEVVEAEKK